MVERIIRVKIIGEETVGPAADKASKSLGRLEKAALGLLTVQFAKRTAQAANELVHLGARSLLARDRLVAFAGGSANATAMLDALVAASDNTIDRLTATEQAARLAQMGIATTGEEMGKVGAIVGKLGDQTLTLQQRMQTFTMMMANQSKLRLDTFGLSVERVTKRQKELEAQGYSTQDAFKVAVYEDAEVALDKLGDTSDSAAVGLDRLSAALTNLKVQMAEVAAEQAKGTVAWATRIVEGEVERNQVKAMEDELVRLGRLKEEDRWTTQTSTAAIGKHTQAYTGATKAVMDIAEATDLYTTMLARAEVATGELGVGMRRGIISYHDAAEAVKTLTLMTAAQAKADLDAEIRFRRRGEQLADFARRREDLERSHQETLTSIIASGQQSASQIAQDAYQERLSVLNVALQAESNALRQAQQARMTALNEAMQAELAALAAGIAGRQFRRNLESMEQQHRDRIQSIRDSAIESEESIETRRFQKVMDRLNKEQQARMAALRARYGKDDTAGDRRESLEEEHRRRMMGLYTESARKRERKRYEDALKELAFQEDETDLLEQFQKEKEGAEASHRDELEGIRQDDIQRQLDEENQRYADAVAEAHRQQALRAQDAAARNAITEQYAAERAALEARHRAENTAQEASHNAQRLALENQLNAQLAAIKQAEIAQRIAQENTAYERQQQDLQRSVDRAAQAYQDSYRRREIARIEHLQKMGQITEEDAARGYQRMVNYAKWFAEALTLAASPLGYAKGTSFHPGGLAIVGEEGPELLDLPRGASVTPMSQVGANGGGGVVVHNYFGRDSVRSEQDIMRIAESQEKAFRLRGVRGDL